MSKTVQNGKGSKRRVEDHQKIRDNWDRIFGSKTKEKSKDPQK